MKNNNVLIYTATLALLAFAACSGNVKEANGDITVSEDKEEEFSEAAIRFTDSKAPNSMMRSTGDLVKDNLIAMTVYAHYTGAGDFADSLATTTPNFMFNQLVEKDNNAWTYSPLKYWPSQHRKVNFFAVAPTPVAANGIELITSGSSYIGYPSFTVTTPAAPAQQQDICVASALDRTDTTGNGKVPLLFAHTMAKVRFSARYVSSETFGVLLRQLKFTDGYSSNTLRFGVSGFEWGCPQPKAATPYP
ncbi:MAG: fimbrillin family protein [Prevotellaceae bacterium]|jgi:hypothetical protein|nr:fimbrillin family protein [Prevotellaceae bacterium]